MGHVNSPGSLSEAQSVLGIANAIAKVLDPKNKERIAKDIADLHALNEDEQAKYADARDTIATNAAILAETQEAAAKAEIDRNIAISERVKADETLQAAYDLTAAATKKNVELDVREENLNEFESALEGKDAALNTREEANSAAEIEIAQTKNDLAAKSAELNSKLAAIKSIAN